MSNGAVSFKFGIHEDVNIAPLSLTGRVLARCDRGAGVRDYRVVWCSDSKRNDEWLYEHELEPKRRK